MTTDDAARPPFGPDDTSSTPPFGPDDSIPLWRGGVQVPAAGGTFDVISPLTKQRLYACSACNVDDAAQAVAAAEQAYPAWRATKPDQRRDILLRAADLFKQQYDSLRWFAHHETGATAMVQDIDFGLAYDAMRSIASLVASVQGRIPTAAAEGQTALVLREPYGVVLALVPWNMPWILGVRAVLSPLAVGNTVVLKGSELSPGVFWALARVLREAGLPDGVLNTVYARPSDAVAVTGALVAHPGVRKINLTGSTPVASAVAEVAGRFLKPMVVEAGGKAPVIICADANIDAAARAAALGAFVHSGQICMSTERLIVHASVLPAFLAALQAAIPALFGPGEHTLVHAAAATRVSALVADAVAHGATLVTGSSTPTAGATGMAAAVVLNPPPAADIYRTESFGPSVSVYSYETDEQALALANDSEFGLVAAVFGEDLRHALRLARGIEAGAVHVNSMSVHDEPVLPHGGVKGSGYGRFNGREGLEEWVRTKVVTWMD